MFGEGAVDDPFAGVCDEGADEQERKGGNKNKKERQQGKKKKKQESDHDEPEEEEKVAEAEVPEEEPEAPEYPINMVYCGSKFNYIFRLILNSFYHIECNLPPEFCSFGQKDSSACKEWLR